jgi:hypothetical protein
MPENPEVKKELSPEIKDILEMVKRYNVLHPEANFFYYFLDFEKDLNHKCEDCGDNCSKPSINKSAMGACGDIWTLREMINTLRDCMEENQDEDGIVTSGS